MVINDILKQVNFIYNTVIVEIKDGSYTDVYFVEQVDCEFLSIGQVREFLTTTKVENRVVLRNIVQRCIEIVDLWNTTLKQLPQKELDSLTFEEMQKSREDGFELSRNNFHAILLSGGKIINVNGTGKATFRDDYEYSQVFLFQDIAKKCALVANWIIDTYPSLHPSISNSTFTHIEKQPTAGVMALFLYFLIEEGKYPRDKSLNAVKSFCEKHRYTVAKPTTVHHRLNVIGNSNSEKNPLTMKNLAEVMPLLKDYPNVQSKAAAEMRNLNGDD